MNKTLLPIRILFILLCTAAGWLVCYTIPANGTPTGVTASSVGFFIGVLVVHMVDVMLKGASRSAELLGADLRH